MSFTLLSGRNTNTVGYNARRVTPDLFAAVMLWGMLRCPGRGSRPAA